MKLNLVPNQTAGQSAQYVQALQLAADGKTADEVGIEMFKSGRSIETWYRHLKEINGYKTKTHLIAEALRNKIIK